jgi:inward rectifier potassium channel
MKHKKSKNAVSTPSTKTYFRFTDDRGRSIRREGMRSNFQNDWYHRLLSLHWAQLVLAVAAFYLLLNTIFAALYLAGGNDIANARAGSFADAFFFSVQTLATIGYGVMSPKTTYANIVVTAETVVGALTLALFAGVFFSHFARPTASVRFTRCAVIGRHDGVPTLMFRAANRRSNRIMQAQVSVTLARREQTLEGEPIRRLYDLPLIRNFSPFFSLSWTVMHRIDEKSPLYGETPDTLAASESEIGVLLSGTDDVYGQTVHSRYGYGSDDIICNSRFQDIFKLDADGNRYIDYTLFDEIKPDIHAASAETTGSSAKAAHSG